MPPKFSVPYLHEWVGGAESAFRHGVPRAMALLRGCPTDGGEDHLFTAYNTVEAARNEHVRANGKSANMIFYKRNHAELQADMVYGADVKYLVFPEARDSKFEDHALAGSYRGPSRDTETPKAAWILTTRGHGRQELVTVSVGCMRVDERAVVARSTRSHPSHQPYGDTSVERPEDLAPAQPDFSTWRNPLTEGFALDAAQPNANATTECAAKQTVWHPSAQPPSLPFVVLICAGDCQPPSDPVTMMHRLSGGTAVVVPIDLKVGGHGHNVLVERVNGAICLLVTHEKCIGVGFSPDCKAVSTLRCRQPGPAMLFTTEEPNGVKQRSTSDAAKRDSAISQFTACTMIGTAHLKSQ